MFNFIIILILLYAIISGTTFNDYKIKLREVPWWILVFSGFTVSLLGLFKFNDERVIFIGCGILLLAKIIGKFESMKAAKE